MSTPQTQSRPIAVPTNTKAPPGIHTPPDSPTHTHHDPLQSALLILMRQYFALHLRADQARTHIHRQLQQNRYIDVLHGPPYERIEGWNGRLRMAKLDYEKADERSKVMLNGEEKVEITTDFMEWVRRRAGELEGLLVEIG
ncbi:hypothetical protein EK21DRAFT_108178 [Setomelanomma holmii]|uniref:Uncharacterized protein n=1 Tax=Setomelanomma holmii TaxID=210430 RepID=A0A9P4HFR7_9PLEO|nr:hypothetical protein EK21DRAFT_108178 [Setomelanomma holmii]